MDNQNRWALITGASSGIGEAFALELAKRRVSNLILTARRTERLERNAVKCRELLDGSGLNVRAISCDLSRGNERRDLITLVSASTPGLSLLINNAGFGTMRPFSMTDCARQLEMIEVNCKAPVELVHGFLPKMRECPDSVIINICSVAAFSPTPYMALYAATKSLLLSFSVALSEELRGTSTGVLAVCPGLTESEFHLVSGLQKKVDLMKSMTAEQVVSESLRRALSPSASGVLINGWRNAVIARAALAFGPSFPARIASRLLSRYQTESDR